MWSQELSTVTCVKSLNIYPQPVCFNTSMQHAILRHNDSPLLWSWGELFSEMVVKLLGFTRFTLATEVNINRIFIEEANKYCINTKIYRYSATGKDGSSFAFNHHFFWISIDTNLNKCYIFITDCKYM